LTTDATTDEHSPPYGKWMFILFPLFLTPLFLHVFANRRLCSNKRPSCKYIPSFASDSQASLNLHDLLSHSSSYCPFKLIFLTHSCLCQNRDKRPVHSKRPVSTGSPATIFSQAPTRQSCKTVLLLLHFVNIEAFTVDK